MAETSHSRHPGAPPATTNGRSPARVGADEDWPAQAADTIERVVGAVRDKTAVPLDRLARVLVYGLLAGILGVATFVLLVIAAVRALDEAVPEDVWAAHAITGGIFTLAGLFLWTKRARRA